MALSYRTALRNARLDEIIAAIGSSAKIRIYSGTPPADVNTALSGNTLLAELTCSATVAPAAASATLTFNAITQDSSADNTGTATFFRILDSAGTTAHVQGTVGAGSGDLSLNTTSIVSGAVVSISSCVITAGNP